MYFTAFKAKEVQLTKSTKSYKPKLTNILLCFDY